MCRKKSDEISDWQTLNSTVANVRMYVPRSGSTVPFVSQEQCEMCTVPNCSRMIRVGFALHSFSSNFIIRLQSRLRFQTLQPASTHSGPMFSVCDVCVARRRRQESGNLQCSLSCSTLFASSSIGSSIDLETRDYILAHTLFDLIGNVRDDVSQKRTTARADG